MKIAVTLQQEAFDALEDYAIKENYTQLEDGSYMLSELVEGGWESAEGISGLRSVLKKERQNARIATAELSKLTEQIGEVDPEQITTLQTELTEAQSQADALKKQLTVSKLNSALSEAIDKANGLSHLLRPALKDRVAMTGDGELRVLNEDGVVLLAEDGKPMSIDALVSDMREDPKWAGAFRSNMKSGGGTPPGGNAGGGNGNGTHQEGLRNLRRSTMTTKQKVAYVKEHGEDGLLSLPY